MFVHLQKLKNGIWKKSIVLNLLPRKQVVSTWNGIYSQDDKLDFKTKFTIQLGCLLENRFWDVLLFSSWCGQSQVCDIGCELFDRETNLLSLTGVWYGTSNYHSQRSTDDSTLKIYRTIPSQGSKEREVNIAKTLGREDMDTVVVHFYVL